MKQKRIWFWSLFALVMVAMMSAGFVACGPDNSDTPVDPNPVDPDVDVVIGTWSGQDGKDYLILTFKRDGTGTWISHYDDSDSGMETDSGSFTYEKEGKSKGVITVRVYDSYSGYYTDYSYFEIKGNKMYLYEHDYGDDLEWVLTKE